MVNLPLRVVSLPLRVVRVELLPFIYYRKIKIIMNRGKKLIELSPNYTVSMAKVLTDVVVGDSVSARKLLYTALSLVNPKDIELEAEFPACREWAIKNNSILAGMTPDNIIENDTYVSILGIERFYELNPDKMAFTVDYTSFINTWYSDKEKRNHHKSLQATAAVAHNMGIGQVDKLKYGNGTRVVTGSIPIFRSIKIIGYDEIIIKLNPDFMPYIVLLNQIFIGMGFLSFPVQYMIGQEKVAGMAMTAFALRNFRIDKPASQPYRVDIASLRAQTGCEKKYPVWADFKKSMIEKGITSVNEDENSDLEIELVSTEKRGKNISHVNFRFKSESFKSIKKATPQQLNYLNKKTAEKKPSKPIVTEKKESNPEYKFTSNFKSDSDDQLDSHKNAFLTKFVTTKRKK
jgi:hypothetical protein